jgi:hypothetical protein
MLRASPAAAKSDAKLRWIRRKLGVGSAELSAGTLGRRLEIVVFGLFLQINVTVRRISYILTKQANNLTSF